MRGRYFYTIEQIDKMLVNQMERLARQLAPDGTRQGHEYIAINPARVDTGRGSFSINLNTGVWADFAAGQGGKALPGLSLVAYLATEGDFQRAVEWAKRWLGLEGEAPDPAIAAKIEAQIKKSRADQKAKREEMRRFAFSLWIDAVPLTGEDPASLYLKARALDPAEMEGGRFPRCLRFHPRLKHRAHGEDKFPALVACQSLEGESNGFAGIHRIYLAENAGTWGKAFDDQAKVSLGYKAGATIRIARGKSGKNLNHAPEGEWVHATEGVEDALALSIALPGERVVAAYCMNALGAMRFPPQIGGVIIVPDNDTDPKLQRNLELRCLDLADRHEVKIAWLPDEYKDVNDMLIGKKRT